MNAFIAMKMATRSGYLEHQGELVPEFWGLMFVLLLITILGILPDLYQPPKVREHR